MNRVRDDIRMTFLSFCHFRPDLAARYLAGTDTHDRDARDILRFPGSAIRAAPTALADGALKSWSPTMTGTTVFIAGGGIASGRCRVRHGLYPDFTRPGSVLRIA